jgi:hypothetical protein
MRLNEVVKAEASIGALLQARVDDGKLAMKIRKIAKPFKDAIVDFKELQQEKVKELAGTNDHVAQGTPEFRQLVDYTDGLLDDDHFNPPPDSLNADDLEKIKIPRKEGGVSALTPDEIDGLYSLGIIKEA